jgi:hypothetical protein
MAIVMTKDGHVRPLQPSDLKEVAGRDERIRQLERQCAVLSTHVDRQGRVVEAAIAWADWLRERPVWDEPESVLEYAVRGYVRKIAELTEEKRHGD